MHLLSSHRTRWWTNFLPETEEPPALPGKNEGYPVEVEIGRVVRKGRAVTLRRDSAYFRNAVRGFLTALPRDAVVYGIKLDADRRPLEQDIEDAASHVILVEIKLDPN